MDSVSLIKPNPSFSLHGPSMAYPHLLKILKFLSIILINSLICLCFYGCQSYSKPAYSGRVIDFETGEPLPNTIIDVKYWKGSYGLIEQHSKVISWCKIKTDKNGYFKIPPISTSISALSWDSGVTFSVQKHGYTELIMFNLGDCLAGRCEEQTFDYPHDKTKKISISSHLIRLSKINP